MGGDGKGVERARERSMLAFDGGVGGRRRRAASKDGWLKHLSSSHLMDFVLSRVGALASDAAFLGAAAACAEFEGAGLACGHVCVAWPGCLWC